MAMNALSVHNTHNPTLGVRFRSAGRGLLIVHRLWPSGGFRLVGW
jgi:hypothetical protein